MKKEERDRSFLERLSQSRQQLPQATPLPGHAIRDIEEEESTEEPVSAQGNDALVDEFRAMEQQMNEAAGGVGSVNEPVSPHETPQEGQLTLDVYQTNEAIVIKSTIAGVKSKDLDVSITNDMVTIRGVRRNPDDVPEEQYFYQECYWGVFSRSVILPVEVKPEEARASVKDGILTIVLPKVDKDIAHKIQVIED